MSMSMLPSPLTCEKSRTLLRILLAILGVPLDLLAISATDFSSTGTFRIPAVLLMISASSSGVYISNLQLTPNLSLNGALREPALVVAPISVNLAMSSLMDLAAGPLPIIMSRA